MTISSTANRASFVGSGTSGPFAFPYPLITKADLVVISVNDTTAVETTLVLDTDYTLAGTADSVGRYNAGVDITTTDSVDSGYTLVVFSDPALTQSIDFVENDPDPVEQTELGLDKLTLIARRLDDRIERALRVSDGTTGIVTELPTPVGNSAIGWNASATALINIEMETGTTLADMASASGSHLIGDQNTGAGSVLRTVGDKLDEWMSVKDKGATGLGVASDTAAFTAIGSDSADFEGHIPAGIYKISTLPAPTQTGIYVVHNGATFTGASYLPNRGMIKYGGITDPWVTPLWSGIYEYMGENSVFNVRAKSGGIGFHSATRSSTGTGAAGEANISYSAFGYADYVGGSDGTWAYYGTVLRVAGHTGAAHGMELDLGNLGSDVEIYPSAMFPAGNNNTLWLASGGEAAFASPAATFNSVSAAIGIISNDPANNARFLKGIVFHNKALEGVDGDGVGRGPALALSPGHSFIYFNNSNQVAGEYSCTNTDINKGLYMDLSEFGLLVRRRQSAKVAFQAGGTANGVNYFNMANSVTGAAVEIQALGDDTNIDMYLVPKGTGVVRFGATTGSADVACNGYITIKDNGGTTRKLMVTA